MTTSSGSSWALRIRCDCPGDGAVAGRPLRHDDALRRWAQAAGLTVVAQASQNRPPIGRAMRDAFAGATKREHAVLVARAAERSRDRANGSGA